MTKQDKKDLVEYLSSSFLDSNIIVCDYKGLSVKELEAFRRKATKSGLNVKVIKNKLAAIAFKNRNIDIDINGTNIFVWGKDQIALSKDVQEFADSNKEKFVVKLGYLDNSPVDSTYIESIAKLPSKNELIGMLLSVWSAPIRYLVTGIDNLSKSKE